MKMKMEDYIRISPDVMKKNLDNRKSLTEKLVEYYLSSNKKDICIIASGSSLNGAITAEMFMTNNLKCNVYCVSPTEFINYRMEKMRECNLIVVSQSGCSTNIIQLVEILKKNKMDYFCLTGNKNGDLYTYSDNVIEYGVDNETIGYVTLGFVTLVEFLILFANEVALKRRTITEDKYSENLQNLERAIATSRELYKESENFVKLYYDQIFKMDSAIIVADGANMGTAREAALKISETLKIPAVYYESEEYAHGPNMQLTPWYHVFFIDFNPKSDRMYNVFNATGTVTKNVYLVTNRKVKRQNNVIELGAGIDSDITPLFTVVLFQYICAIVTKEKNNFKCHPDFDKFAKLIKTKTDKYMKMKENNEEL